MINKSSGLDMEAASDFKLLDRAVVDSLNAMPERLTFFRAMSSWVGYKTERVYFDVADREIGESKWSVKATEPSAESDADKQQEDKSRNQARLQVDFPASGNDDNLDIPDLSFPSFE